MYTKDISTPVSKRVENLDGIPSSLSLKETQQTPSQPQETPKPTNNQKSSKDNKKI